MTISPLISLASDARLTFNEDCASRLDFPRGALDLSQFPEAVRRALGMLATKPINQSDLAAQVFENDDPTPIAWLYHALGLFAQHGLLIYTLELHGEQLLMMRPMARGPLFDPVSVVEKLSYQLSRLAYLRRDGDRLLIECPVSAVRVWVTSKKLAELLFELTQPKSVKDLVDTHPADLVAATLGYFLAMKVITPCDAEGRTVEDKDSALRQWEFHDLAFHAHTRIGRHFDPLGAHFPFEAVCPPPPALKSVPNSPSIPLSRPNLATLETRSLVTVMEQRRSWRNFDDKVPITIEQLGIFLYRTARVRTVMKHDDGQANRYDQSNRPYPNGGAMYELELYVTVRCCTGLEQGIYYYDPRAHALHCCSSSEAPRAALLNQASISTGGVSSPQVLITMTSRFDRMSWKYCAMAYATTLKHVGVLMGMMCLTASDMDLGACALGSGLAELAPGEIDLDYFKEAPVGDLMLGSRGEPPARHPVHSVSTKQTSSLPDEVQAFLQDPSSLPDPSLLYAKLLSEAPICRTRSGAVLISRYEDIAHLIGHPSMSVDHRKTAEARRLTQSPEIESFIELMMSMRDRPDHDRIAAPMRASFKPAAVKALRTQIDALVDESLRPHLNAPRVDIVSVIGKELPVQVTCTMLGIPREDWPQLQVWTELLSRQLSDFNQSTETLFDAERRIESFTQYIRELLDGRRRSPRSNDILTDLLAADSHLTERELIAQCMLVLIGGRDTVTHMISSCVHLLAQYPTQFAASRENSDLIPAALEECLRFESPIRMAARSLMNDLDYGSHRLKKNDTILFLIAAANRDPEQYISPNRFDTARTRRLNLAFGRGAHFCIGQHFARAEGASVLNWLLRNTSSVEQLDLPNEMAWEKNLAFRGLANLNIRLHQLH